MGAGGGGCLSFGILVIICINLRCQLRMINSKRAHQAERSGCRSESEMLSFGASLRLVYITRQIRICNSIFSEHRSFSIHYIPFCTTLKPFFILVLSGTHCFCSFIPEITRASFISRHRLLAILYTLADIFFINLINIQIFFKILES